MTQIKAAIFRQVDRARVLRAIEARKHERDGEREITWSEERGVEIGIEPGELLGRRFLRMIGVRPEALQRPRPALGGRGFAHFVRGGHLQARS